MIISEKKKDQLTAESLVLVGGVGAVDLTITDQVVLDTDSGRAAVKLIVFTHVRHW